MLDLTSPTGSVLAALGLASAAGLNAWIPLLAVGVLGRAGEIDLTGTYDVLATGPGLAVIAALLALDFVGDKIPAIDSVVHLIGTVVHPASGALVFGASTDTPTDLPWVIAAATGAGPAGALHALRMAARPLATIGTVGLANPFVSLAEDATSASLVLVAVVVPLLAAILALGLLAGLIVAARRARARGVWATRGS